MKKLDAARRSGTRREWHYPAVMIANASESRVVFDPASFESFRFMARELDERGRVTLRYGLDDSIGFVEEFDLPVGAPLRGDQLERSEDLLALLHWVAGVSYFKTAVPPVVSCETGLPRPAAGALLESLYSEGLGEHAFVNRLAALPRPSFPVAQSSPEYRAPILDESASRVLVPIGGGKDSVVALEIVRRSGQDMTLFSVGNAPAIARTATVAGIPHLVAHRRLDPGLGALNRAGALNGHVPITAIVACVASLTAALNGFDTVAMANERSASSGNLFWEGIEVNHQFSKSLRAERLLSDALSESAPGLAIFSVLRPASELTIARAFARLAQYHGAFTSCNAIFRLDPALRASSWCCDCPKCRFVFLVLAPFSDPAHLREVFGRDLLAEESQLAGFALLTATGGDKPFECVGEEEESLAAIRMLVADPRWADHAVVRRLAKEVLPLYPDTTGSLDATLKLSEDHCVPAALLTHVRAILGA